MDKELEAKGKLARNAARQLALTNTKKKNGALLKIAQTIMDMEPEILVANDEDVDRMRAAGADNHVIDRLMLNPQRLEGISKDVRTVATLPDPVGEIFEARTLPNGLEISKRRVPIGVIGVVYESRPNVTIDISALCIKSGNAAILRGGKESLRTNMALAKAVHEGCEAAELPPYSAQLIESTERSIVMDMLRANDYIDIIIPRGGASLHKLAIENSSIPVITGGMGVCHIYVDRTADMAKAIPIIYNAKVQRPTVCNALDTLLVHRSLALTLLPQVADRLGEAGVEFRCDKRSYELLRERPGVRQAVAEDFGQEFLSLVMSIRVVDTLEEALDHIYKYSTEHSDSIITEDYSAAMRFVKEVNSAAVYVNASTRFTDGGQFGLGAEVAISTQPLHARGPMGLKELTTYKWVIFGNGQIRD